MTWRTHALFGADCALCLGLLPPSLLLPFGHSPAQPYDPALLAALAGFGALLPDLDASESKVRHVVRIGSVEPFAIVADLVHATFGHRGLLHSAAGAGAAGVLIAAACACLEVDWRAGIALWAGYASHLAADAFTPAGIPLLYPWRRKRVHLLPKRLRITTGSAAEDALMVLMALPIMLALLPGLLAPS